METTDRNSPKSLAMLAASMLIFGSIGVFRRFILLPSAVIACARGIVGALFLTLFTMVRGKRLFTGIDRRTAAWLLISGSVIGFNWILLFEAYNYTSVSVATLCYYMQPTIVVFASSFIFGERMTKKKAVCCMIALFGMILVSGVAEGGGTGVSDLRGILLGLSAAVLYSTVVLINKRVKGVDAFDKTTIQLAAAGLVLIPYIIAAQQLSDLEWTWQTAALMLVVTIIHTGISYALYFGSMDGLRTQTVALFSYIDPITALVLSAVLLHEKMSVWGILGAFLILGSALICEL